MRGVKWCLLSSLVIVPALSGCIVDSLDGATEAGFDFRVVDVSVAEGRCSNLGYNTDPEDPVCQSVRIELVNERDEDLRTQKEEWTAVTTTGAVVGAQSVTPERVGAGYTASVTLKFMTEAGEAIDVVRYKHGGDSAIVRSA